MKIKTRRTLIGAAWACVAVLSGSALTGVAIAAEQSRSAGGPAAVAAASGSPAPANGTGAARRGLRLGGRVLHGQVTVRAKGGVRTVDIQVGAVTALTAGTVTVRSQDGFTWTWTLTGTTVVRNAGSRSTASDLAEGQTVRVLGPAASSPGGSPTARLIGIRPAKGAGTGGRRPGRHPLRRRPRRQPPERGPPVPASATNLGAATPGGHRSGLARGRAGGLEA